MSLPTADDLFRPTVVPDVEDGDNAAEAADAADPAGGTPRPAVREEGRTRTPSGRVRHDEKMTVYVTADELLDIEHARLTLRREHGLAVDRGRLVRAAVAIALADLDENAADSVLVARLGQA